MKVLYQKFFTALPIRFVDPDEHLDLLTEDELFLVHDTEKQAMGLGILIELVAYLLSYLPVYAFPEFFAARSFSLGGPFTAALAPLPVAGTLWSLLVSLAEMYVLLLVNLAAVHGIAVATGYIRRDRPAAHAHGLIGIALERRFSREAAYGIDPFQGLNRWLLYAYLLLNRLKGFLGNLLIRASLTTLFGNGIRRYLLDFSGMPLYMAINVYSTRVILRNARVVVMGQAAIEGVLRRLPDLRPDAAERELLYDALQFVAVNKRGYHVNHYYLTQGVLNRFGIPVEQHHLLPGNFTQKLERARPEVAAVCRLIVILGFIVDGRLSWRESRSIGRLEVVGALNLRKGELDGWRRDFVDGRGLAGPLAHCLGSG